MKLCKRPLLYAAGVSIVLAGAAIPWITSLEITNLQNSSTWIVPLREEERFYLLYDHSIYGGEVRENYRVTGAGLMVESLETPHPEIGEYYGFETKGPVYPIGKALASLALKLRATQGRQILCGAYPVNLADIGTPGQTVMLRAKKISLFQWIALNIGGTKKAPKMPN